MIPDDRLRDLLEQAEGDGGPDPAFVVGLQERLETERRKGLSSKWRHPRWLTPVLLAPAVVAIAVAGLFAVGSFGPGPGGASRPERSPTAGISSGSQTLAPTFGTSDGPEPSAVPVTCRLDLDPAPAKGVLGRVLGSGFKANTALTLTFTPPSGSTVTRHGGIDDPTLVATGDGSMAPQSWEGYPGGVNHWSVSDGSCTANIETTVPE